MGLLVTSPPGARLTRPLSRGRGLARAAKAHPNLSAAAAGRGSRLRELLQRPEIVVMPSCHDAMTAKLIEGAGFEAAFMSGYAVSATRLGLPDVGLATYTEMEETGRNIVTATDDLLVIGDGDTGFGGVANVQRTVRGYARAGFAGISVEDQVFPKRCAFAKGVEVVPRGEAVKRMKAAVDARDEARAAGEGDLLVIGRTDCRLSANVGDGLEEALWRCRAFEEVGADIVYFEAPQGAAEMEALNAAVSVPTLLAQVEKPDVRLVGPGEAQDLGYSLVLYGLTLLNVQVCAVKQALAGMRAGAHPTQLVPFDELYETVGFEPFYDLESKFESKLG